MTIPEHIFDYATKLRENCFNLNEKFPEEVWKLTQSECKLFMSELTLDYYNISTTSEMICDEFIRLAKHCGWKAEKIQYNSCSNNPIFNIIVDSM